MGDVIGLGVGLGYGCSDIRSGGDCCSSWGFDGLLSGVDSMEMIHR